MGNVACVHHYSTKSGACAEYLSLQLISKDLTGKMFRKNITFFISSNRSSENKKKKKHPLEAQSLGSESQFHHFLLVNGT